MRFKLFVFIAIECALVGSLMLWGHAFTAPDDCRWISYFNPPEPPISRLEGVPQ